MFITHPTLKTPAYNDTTWLIFFMWLKPIQALRLLKHDILREPFPDLYPTLRSLVIQSYDSLCVPYHGTHCI